MQLANASSHAHRGGPAIIGFASPSGDTLDFRLVVQKLRREFTHAQNFLFKIAAQSARMREFSSQFLDNQPEIECKPSHRISEARICEGLLYRVLNNLCNKIPSTRNCYEKAILLWSRLGIHYSTMTSYPIYSVGPAGCISWTVVEEANFDWSDRGCTLA